MDQLVSKILEKKHLMQIIKSICSFGVKCIAFQPGQELMKLIKRESDLTEYMAIVFTIDCTDVLVLNYIINFSLDM